MSAQGECQQTKFFVNAQTRYTARMRFQIALLLACAWSSTVPGQAELSPLRPAAPAKVPEQLRRDWQLATFYEKFLDVSGIPLLASGKVSDHALLEAAWLVDRMIGHRTDLLAAIAEQKVRIAIMAPDEFTTDIPEHSDLRPKEYWDKRARGLGATRRRPAVSCGEENLLCYPGDPYAAENILIHEFAHVIHERGLSRIDETFDRRLRNGFDQARKSGLWKGTYAGTNPMEYWAEGVQSWFDANRENDSEHNHVNTRDALKEYDPSLAQLLIEIFGDTAWRYVRPTDRRPPSPHLATFARDNLPRLRWPAALLAWHERVSREETFAPPDAERISAMLPDARSEWRSSGDGAATRLTFFNAAKTELRLEWIDFAGDPQNPVHLRPRDHFQTETFVGHVWRVSHPGKDATRYFVAVPKPGSVVLKDFPD